MHLIFKLALLRGAVAAPIVAVGLVVDLGHAVDGVPVGPMDEHLVGQRADKDEYYYQDDICTQSPTIALP
jgi:hypothetical protein